MPEITWDANDGYIHSNQVSKLLRESLRPKGKFRQFCTIPSEVDGAAGLNKGNTFYWNVISAPARQNFRLAETDRIASSSVGVTQNSLTVVEMGRAIEHTSKAQLLSFQDWEAIVENGLAFMAGAQFDVESFLQFKATPLHVAPTSGTSTTSITAVTNSHPTITNNVALGTGHIKAIGDYMKNRNIPPHMQRDAYVCVAGIDTLRPVKDALESIHQYTETGLSFIKYGEIGRYEDFIFVEQTMIPAGGAYDTTTFDAYTDTADAWNNAKSSWAMFFGDDPVSEAPVVPEEVRAKLPEDYGRDKGAAWYALTGFGISHPDATNARIVMWSSAA
jgi:hypothetical protein